MDVSSALTGPGDPLEALRAAGPEVEATVPAARNLRRLVEVAERGLPFEAAPRGWTRAALLDLFDRAGLDVTSLVPERDPDVAWVPLPVDGSVVDVETPTLTLRRQSADALEEVTARAWRITARATLPEAPDCSIVLPVHGHHDRTARCLRAIFDAPPRASFEIIAVDDASPEPFVAPAGVRSLRLEQQRGFAVAANAGARAARGTFLAFLHNDCVPAAGWLDELLDALAQAPHPFSAAGPRVLYPDLSVASAGMALGPDLLPYPLYRHAAGDSAFVERPRAVSTLASPGLVLRRRAFVAVGGFDERLWLGFEDGDLSLRLRARGGSMRYHPAAVVVHEEGVTEGPRTFIDHAVYFRAKWEGRIRSEDDGLCAEDDTDTLRVRARGWHLPRPGRSRVSGTVAPPSLWSTLVFDHSGYANEARTFVRSLERARAPVFVNPFRWPPPMTAMPEADARRLWELATCELPARFVHVVHLVNHFFQRHPRAVANVGRTMFETDRLPPDRVAKCLEMDRIWVPSDFNMETFANAGVPREKLRKLPAGLEVELFDPSRVQPMQLPGLEGFVFLAVFVWSRRKGWDLLLRAYLEEFGPRDDVTLLLGVTPVWSSTFERARTEAEWFVRNELHGDPDGRPRIRLVDLALPPQSMPSLYRVADAFVLPTRGEGWGRPYMEAMAMGLPTIGTGWSGNTEFMNEGNSYLVQSELVDVPEDGWRDFRLFRGHRWAAPSVPHLRQLMRQVYEDRTEARERGARARRDIVSGYSCEAIAPQVIRLLREVSPAE